MKLRTLGKSGYSISEMGIGCWQLGNDFGPMEDERATAILQEADRQGMNFWDTADVYGGGVSESRIGGYCRENPSDRFIVTKVGRDGTLYPGAYTKQKVRANIEGSLKRLHVEALDLVQLHCIPTEVLKAGDMLAWMEDFQQEGLIKHFGASVETMDEALFAITHPQLTSIQTIFNVFRQDQVNELFPKAIENQVGIIVRLPLASGVLSGKMQKNHQFAESDHRHYNRDGAFFSVGETFSGIPFEQAVEFAETLKAWLPEGMSLAQMAMRWVLDHDAVSSVITGASRVEQVAENASVSSLEPLSSQLHEKLTEFYFNTVKTHIRGVM
ncbi:aldo/keto reductase [Marinibactrum halimedae]|uniref:Aldo/keto reductase n=2 Tax=Marinibactrum halimedae TaxID=1444977 RepID=A0AA37T9S5_9GAMM|nr:aldo/keto reductase [Marinibactrum halimedae]